MKTLTVLLISFCFTWSLTGQGWVRQNPFEQFARLNDVDFDGLHGVTVGNDGVLFITDDGGNTWLLKKTPDADENLKTAFVLPGTNGDTMLAGGDSLLLISTDGGAHWNITYNDLQGIYKIELMDNGDWLGLGSTYGIRSSDHGGFWQPFNNPGLDATAGHFTTILTGWVAAGGFNNTQIWVTTNGGFNWELRDQTKFTTVTDLVMLNALVGYLASGSEIYKTIDGGNTWIPRNANPSGNITDLHVITENEVWASLDNGSAFYSLTAGNSWVEKFVDLFSGNSSQGIYADLAGHVYMPGKYVSMLYSDDFGDTWRDQIPGTKANLFQPHFYNELVGIVGGSDGTLMITVNGGDNWGVIPFPKNDHFFAAAMVDNIAMVIGSSRGRVYYSENLGASWDTIGTGLGQITDIEAINRQIFIITTEDGRIYRTTDQGNQWNKEYDNGGNLLSSVDFVTNQKGWAAGYNGELLVTTNGGDDWIIQPAPGKGRFSDIAFTNDQEGWAVSTSFTDSLWYTKDAGQSWQTTLLPYKSFWNGVSFTTPDTGWIAGGLVGVGEVLRTNDRGATWAQNHVSPEIFNGIYAVPEIETVWAVGVGGNIMKYSPCFTLPFIANLTGEGSPCKGDTVTYSVTPTNVDNYLWIFPQGWEIIGNPDSSTVFVIAGENAGDIKVIASNVCGNITEALTEPLTPTDIPIITIAEGAAHVLFTNLTSLEYQWYFNGALIPGATEPFYTAGESGTYQLIVTVPGTGCIGYSNTLDVTIIVGTTDSREDRIFTYPVPADNILYISSVSGKDELDGLPVSVYAPDGSIRIKSTLSGSKLDISQLGSGMYILIIKSAKENWVTKFLVE